MPKARRTSYNLAFKLKIVAEAKAVENNSEIAREYSIPYHTEYGEDETDEEFDTESEDEP